MSSGLDLKRDDAPLPSGTVTFVFSDIEGSTTRWERNREAMREALRRHDVLMRRSIEACGGRVFKTMGDAFFAVFTRPEDGARAALDAQRALAAEDFSAVDGLRVRMALHSGSSDERDSDYFGPAVNRAARLLAVAHGGQILSSRAVAEHLRNALPPIELRDLGAHRLKDLIEPEYVFQLGAPGLAADFPPLLSLSVLDNNLPQQLTNLIGREHEISEIEPLLEQHRLVTLIGAGGVGKTRVALQAGADLLDGSGDGVWFAELAPLRDAALVAETIASALGLTERADTPALDSLLRFLKDRRLLLLFDNCEHLIAEVARIGEAILRECPNVRLLATSREPLHIAGERIYPIQSLAVPPERAGFSATEAARYSAISLFVERATASDPTFVLTDDVASIVGEICRRIDGIPLAIELAASRVRVLAPRQLAKKLDDRFRVLTGGARTALPRQQTMRALIEWSYDLLSRQEQTLFRRLSIFAGGWTLQAASDVCAGDDGSGCEALDEDEVFDLLSALIDKSLVVSEPCIEEQRYRLLESTREYARERLELRETEMTLRKHAVWFADFANRVATLNEMPAALGLRWWKSNRTTFARR